VLALLAGLEIPPPGTGTAARPVAVAEPHDPCEDLEEPFDPERRAPALSGRDEGGGMRDERGVGRSGPAHPSSLNPHPSPKDRGDAWEPPADDADQDAPTDGRQLLGWARKQQPDAMGTLLSYGKRNGLHSKIVAWTPEQVRAAYRHARGTRPST